MDLIIKQDTPYSTEAQKLLSALDEYLNSLYAADENHILSAYELSQSNVVFLVAKSDTEAVGCGAIRGMNDEYAEIKRMYVHKEYRGRGIGGSILRALEKHAQANGYETIRLETGIYQPEAIQLYEKLGYSRRGPFGDYQVNGISLFYEKHRTL